MKKFRKILSVALCACLMGSTFCFSAEAKSPKATSSSSEVGFVQDLRLVANEYIAHNPEYADIIEKEYESYCYDEMLISSYNTSREDAIDTFETSLKIALRNASSENINQGGIAVLSLSPTGHDSLFHCIVDTTIKQERGTWCGVAATQMALTGIQNSSPSNLISGFTLPSQQDIAEEVCYYDGEKDLNGTAYVYYVTKFLNRKIKSTSYRYTYKEITSNITPEDVRGYIQGSLYINRPVILHAKPYQAFDYYSGISETCGHYVVIDQCYLNSDLFRVVDPSDLSYNDSPYQGIHYVTLDEIYNSLYCPSNDVSGRYLIYG